MKLKKYLLSFAGIASLALPAVAISCGTTRTSNIDDYIEKQDRVAEIDVKANVNSEFVKSDKIKAKNIKFALITDTGKVSDKSFNQSAWEALLQIADQTAETIDGKRKEAFEFTAVEPKGNSYEQSYNTAVDEGANVIVLPGFSHGEHIKPWIEKNKAKLEKNKVIIIGIDFDLDVDYQNFYALNFDVNQASWQLGHAIGKFLATVYPEQADKRKSSAFGGGPFFGVTDFITGYLKGLHYFNQSNPIKTTHASSLPLDSGFQPDEKQKSVITGVLDQGATFVYPVAGPATSVTIEEIRKNAKFADKLVIGVDVDQSKAFQNGKEYLATSVLKNIGQAVYDVILAAVFEDGASQAKIEKYKNTSKQTTQSYFAGFDAHWVGLAPSTMKNEAHRKVMNDAIEEAKRIFAALPEDEKAFISKHNSEKGGAEVEQPNIASVVNKLVEIVNS